ncbi:class I SAM-dependent methyltransferase [Solirubrobacter sp. CPCC 204708]|uniref:Class I SAM-dependent methyltransferase n=1 Tax=Solirubrobacter deserti TaxID=2282478 RepID=A0ABT4RNY9_9ACTN|nr:class I SAM-dependent methyltransferase [Solirubrobacter deserti]MBE2317423.1 class I SAM-dependent methyltransferase [Solirubrobacter deserti]MDA0140005.1 class I SAM-dependent methyltransferase [Solirubrobacter deserti]
MPRLPWRKGKQDRPTQISEALQAELDGDVGFMYPWALTDQVQVEAMHPELPSVHATREALIEPLMREALASGGRVVDLGAHEGYFSHRALAWGADSVLALDVREIDTRRAELLRDHFSISPEALQVRTASVYDVDPAEIGQFDVVLVLGLIYHLENPIGALRVAASLAKPGALVVVESQLTRQAEPIEHGWGVTGWVLHEPASWAARLEPAEEQEHTPLSAFGGVISLVPNQAALLQALQVAGVDDVKILKAEPDHNPQYVAVDRVVVAGRKTGAA